MATLNPYPPAHVFDEDQTDELAELQDAGDDRPAHVIANELAAKGNPLFPGADPNAIPSLDAGEPAALTPASSTVAPAGAELVVAQAEAGEALLPAPAAPQADGDGLELLGMDDLTIPRLRIRNPGTDAEGVPEGHFFLSTDFDENSAELELAVLQVTPQRELKIPIDDDKRKALLLGVETKLGRRLEVDEKAFTLCRSLDRKLPIAGGLSPKCEGCVFGTWRREDGKNVRECQEIYELAVVDLESLQPIVWTLRGSGMKPGKKLNTMLVMKLRRLKGKGKAWQFATRVKLDRVKSTKPGVSPYYVPNFGKLEAIDDAELVEELGGLRASMIGAKVAPEVPADEV